MRHHSQTQRRRNASRNHDGAPEAPTGFLAAWQQMVGARGMPAIPPRRGRRARLPWDIFAELMRRVLRPKATANDTQSIRKALLARILDAHERSVSFGRSTPWPRDVILKIDAKTFPEAFAPEGRPIPGVLLAAAAELEASGCVRVARHARGQLRGEIEEIRVGPAEITRTYEVGESLGCEPLSSVLSAVEQHASTLAQEPQPEWMRTFLLKLAGALRRADPALLGLSRARLKRERRSLVSALTAAVALSQNRRRPGSA